MTDAEPAIGDRAGAAESGRFAPAAAVANAVLYEGYVLYPYRASSAKNRCRWQFGVLAPPDYAAKEPSERSAARTQCILEAGQAPLLYVRIRFLHLQRRTLHATGDDGQMRAVGALEVGGTTLTPWDEAVEELIDIGPVALVPVDGAHLEVPIGLPGRIDIEEAISAEGRSMGQIVRTRAALDGRARIGATWADRSQRLLKVVVTVENTTAWSQPDTRREAMMSHAFVAVHTMMGVDDGAFVSSLEPPVHAREAVRSCRNLGSFPVLIGAEGADDLVLSSPIILYDHPAVAPQSQGDLYDATEIDEILALRVLTLTAGEKAEARALDPRAAAIVDRCDAMAPEAWAALHGTVRSSGPAPPPQPGGVAPWDPTANTVAPARETVRIGGVHVRAGTKVRLHPSHRADAQDLFAADRVATVAGIFRDVNGVDLLVAVTVDDDPATELLLWHGRYLYFHPDEVEPIAAADGAP